MLKRTVVGEAGQPQTFKINDLQDRCGNLTPVEAKALSPALPAPPPPAPSTPDALSWRKEDGPMAENTKIEWANHTFNPWWGCTRISRACDHCYAAGLAKRTGSGHLWEGERRRTSASNWQQPHKWNKQAASSGTRPRVFCASMADVFDNQVPTRWRDDLWQLIDQTPNLDWLLLTKRPQNIAKMLPDTRTGVKEWGDGWPNVWLGASTENRTEMLRRGAALKAIPAVVHFWSAEPLVESLGDIPPEIMPNWIIAGGESGHHAVPTHPDWARSIRNQCAAAGVAFHWKQWGEWAACQSNDGTWITDANRFCRLNTSGTRSDDGWPMQWVGKKFAGRLLDGIEHNGFPSVSVLGHEG